jgi:tuberous sclerosis protein 2
LDEEQNSGKFTYVWTDEIIQVTFHVATLMWVFDIWNWTATELFINFSTFLRPNLQSDPNCIEKKKWIGNDYVLIIYNESGEEYNLNTIKVCHLK